MGLTKGSWYDQTPEHIQVIDKLFLAPNTVTSIVEQSDTLTLVLLKSGHTLRINLPYQKVMERLDIK